MTESITFAFGKGMGINSNGTRIALGGSSDDSNKGAVWIFTKVAGVWTQQGNKIVANDTVGLSKFGESTAISADGTLILVGGSLDNGGFGATWVFTRDNSIWTQQGSKVLPLRLKNSSGFGASMAMSANAEVFGSIDSQKYAPRTSGYLKIMGK